MTPSENVASDIPSSRMSAYQVAEIKMQVFAQKYEVGTEIRPGEHKKLTQKQLMKTGSYSYRLSEA